MMDGPRRELKRLRDKLRADEREFRSEAPSVDSEGLPLWDGPGVPLEGYERALGSTPDEELTDEELEVRDRLSPYAELFAQLLRDEKSGGEP